MKKRDQRKQQTPAHSRWRIYLLISVCAVLFVAGFFFAGRQHFSSMDYGMKNSRLRKQIEDLENEKRRLILAREMSLTPAEIKKAAKKAGLADAASAEGDIAQLASVKQNMSPAPAEPQKNSLIIKTSSVAKVPPAAITAVAKTEKSDKTRQVVKPLKKASPTE